MANQAQARSVGVFLRITCHGGKTMPSIPVHSHEEAWVTAWKLKDDPIVQRVEARIGR